MKKSISRDIVKAIEQVAQSQDKFQVSDIMLALDRDASRQYVSLHLAELARGGSLVRAGVGRGAYYAATAKAESLEDKYVRRFRNQNLEEHIVFDAVQKSAPFLGRLKDNVFSMYDYAIQEMLNNAIEHSQSKSITVTTQKQENKILFTVEDNGVGVFRNIQNHLGLKNELEAIEELLKGKTTTDPENHTGEGIFFTSRTSDVFVLDSYDYRLRIDNIIDDIFVEHLRNPYRGTKVQFELDIKSKKHLSDIFEKYQTNPEDHAFNKTDIRIKLYTMGSVYISRSQARRVMAGLDKKFQSVTLDFERVPTVGQAFADEIFRVYIAKHPKMRIEATNMNDAVRFMIERASVVQEPADK